MFRIQRDIASLGGLAAAYELISRGHDLDMMRVLSRSGRVIVRVRKGWYANPGFGDDLYAAWAARGRLACVSALAYHGLGEQPARLHVALQRSARSPEDSAVIAHWSREDLPGDRRAVSVEVALRQASRCRAAKGTL